MLTKIIKGRQYSVKAAKICIETVFNDVPRSRLSRDFPSERTQKGVTTTLGFHPVVRGKVFTAERFTKREQEVLFRGTGLEEELRSFRSKATVTWGPTVQGPLGSIKLAKQVEQSMGRSTMGIPTSTNLTVALKFSQAGGVVRHFNPDSIPNDQRFTLLQVLAPLLDTTEAELSKMPYADMLQPFAEEEEVLVREAIMKSAQIGVGVTWEPLRLLYSEHICGATVRASNDIRLINLYEKKVCYFHEVLVPALHRSPREPNRSILEEYTKIHDACLRHYLDYLNRLAIHTEKERAAIQKARDELFPKQEGCSFFTGQSALLGGHTANTQKRNFSTSRQVEGRKKKAISTLLFGLPTAEQAKQKNLVQQQAKETKLAQRQQTRSLSRRR